MQKNFHHHLNKMMMDFLCLNPEHMCKLWGKCKKNDFLFGYDLQRDINQTRKMRAQNTGLRDCGGKMILHHLLRQSIKLTKMNK